MVEPVIRFQAHTCITEAAYSFSEVAELIV